MIDLYKIRFWARALFEVAKEEKLEDKIIDDLNIVLVVLKSESSVSDYFLNPEIKLEEKKESLKDLLGGKISDQACNFIFELIDKEELKALSLIIERLKKLIYNQSDVVEAEVISAVDLSDNTKNDLLKKIEEKAGKKAKLNTKIDSSLLGGIKVKIGDEMIDLTVRGKLDSLKQEIIN